MGLTVLAVEVDHRLSKAEGGTDSPENLDPICREHHRDKTARERGHKVKEWVGLDGWRIRR
jgi:5-methylcytosine-specific restriction endonuclease McrA